uniref:Uncharacterized protein n=1 Tax=Pyramimonas obovata TaxID=1411642 RepID=A0A7S0MYC1_9CHLO|mmetsp:Transcript_16395/g.35653  ORF Transcript_16395/g.35653 Transcript_16395/m.35653 type:complete len:307 (+) Transcript_16395:177-1097(+)
MMSQPQGTQGQGLPGGEPPAVEEVPQVVVPFVRLELGQLPPLPVDGDVYFTTVADVYDVITALTGQLVLKSVRGLQRGHYTSELWACKRQKCRERTAEKKLRGAYVGLAGCRLVCLRNEADRAHLLGSLQSPSMRQVLLPAYAEALNTLDGGDEEPFWSLLERSEVVMKYLGTRSAEPTSPPKSGPATGTATVAKSSQPADARGDDSAVMMGKLLSIWLKHLTEEQQRETKLDVLVASAMLINPKVYKSLQAGFWEYANAALPAAAIKAIGNLPKVDVDGEPSRDQTGAEEQGQEDEEVQADPMEV